MSGDHDGQWGRHLTAKDGCLQQWGQPSFGSIICSREMNRQTVVLDRFLRDRADNPLGHFNRLEGERFAIAVAFDRHQQVNRIAGLQENRW